jgi:hypothetical protein
VSFTFVKATKTALKARIALEGVSGGGKTYSALSIAQSLGKTIAVIDTEHMSAKLYADIFDFDWLGVDKYSPEVLIQALAAASKHDVVIIDSLSHWWMGTDGMLEQVDRAAKRSGGGNTFAGWKEMRPHERKMFDAMLGFPGHLIATLRTKSEWVIEDNDRGKKVPRKIGLKAEQRDGLEYEFTLVGQMDHENNLIVSKSRCPVLSGAVVNKPGEEFGRTLRDWLESGEADGPSANEIRDEACDDSLTVEELKALFEKADSLGRAGAAVTTDTGDVSTLGDFIRNKAREAQARARAAKEPTE